MRHRRTWEVYQNVVFYMRKLGYLPGVGADAGDRL
jgi:hypothetical protein